MSWLFDRLCEIAAADRVEIVVLADTSSACEPGSSCDTDLAEILLRAARVPQLTTWVLPRRSQARLPALPAPRSIDLDELDPERRLDAMQRLLAGQRAWADAALMVLGDEAVLANDRPSTCEVARRTEGLGELRRVFATDEAGYGEQLRALVDRGLGVSIGGVDPDAPVQVADLIGLASILDALVALRHFAFGASPDESGAPRALHDSRVATG
ncbi:MAG: hypothetical protein AB7L17_03745 [Ilumatobacteraceae bacterium]